MEKAVVFIDGSNFYNGAKRNDIVLKIDFGKLSKELAVGYNLLRTYYYNAPLIQKYQPEEYKKQQRFFGALRNTSLMTVRLGRLEKRDDTYVEKGVDTFLAVDMLSMAYKGAYDAAILITADADFVPVVNEVKSFGKRVFNAYFSKGISFHLRQACDSFLKIDQKLIEKVKR